MNLLVVNKLTKIFVSQSRWLGMVNKELSGPKSLDAISFTLKDNEIVGLIGQNGAGKSTLLHILMGILSPTSGSIYYFGKNFATHQSIIVQDLAFASSYTKLMPSLTVIQTLTFFSQLYNISKECYKKKINELLAYFGLTPYKYKKIAELSAGQYSKVNIIKVFLPEAKIILLDEPTAFLDLESIELLKSLIKKQKKIKKTTFLFTTHNHSDMVDLCDRVLILNKGKLIESCTQQYLQVQK